jgi:hypothetical protein
LIPFEPKNIPQTQYSQFHKAIDLHLFKEAGISGFFPPQPFKVPAKFLNIGNHTDFQWLTLSELNNDVNEFPWSSDKERHKYFEDDTPFCSDVMYTGPPPEPPVSSLAPEQFTPSIMSLAPLIVSSPDKLFFISHSIAGSHREWRLVRVAFRDSIALYPSCLQDGQFLVDFYMDHPFDICYNANNQQFWLQYCNQTSAVFGTMDAHLITPSGTSEDRAKRHLLVPTKHGRTSPTLTPTSTGLLKLQL